MFPLLPGPNPETLHRSLIHPPDSSERKDLTLTRNSPASNIQPRQTSLHKFMPVKIMVRPMLRLVRKDQWARNYLGAFTPQNNHCLSPGKNNHSGNDIQSFHFQEILSIKKANPKFGLALEIKIVQCILFIK